MKKNIYDFRFYFALIICVMSCDIAYSQILYQFCGNGSTGFSGDGGPAYAAVLSGPTCLATDASGNLYFTDINNNRVRKINSGGTINTIAGNGGIGFSGDGGAAVAAQLHGPWGVTVNSSGVYFSDMYNNRIRKIDLSGYITTIAGVGSTGAGGDGGAATAAHLSTPKGIAADGSGNIYIADAGNAKIRKIDASGIITTVVGSGTAGYGGDGGPATAASLSGPTDVEVDASGNLYIADMGNNCIRKVDVAGIISTFAGSTTGGYTGDGGPATAATLFQPFGVGSDAGGNVYIADTYNDCIRKVTSSGTITTIAGTGTAGHAFGGTPTTTQLYYPNDVAAFATTDVAISDDANERILRLCNPADAGIVSGIDTLCPGASATLTSTVAGGYWLASTPAIATISAAGVTTGVSFGIANMSYIVTNNCQPDTAIFTFWVKNIASCSAGVQDMTRVSASLTIKPEPNKGTFMLNLELPLNETAKIVITNVLGSKVKEFVTSGNMETLVEMDVSPGIYFLSAITKTDKLDRKLTIE